MGGIGEAVLRLLEALGIFGPGGLRPGFPAACIANAMM